MFCYAAKNIKIRDNLTHQYELKIASNKENDYKTDFENVDEKGKESVLSINSQQPRNKSLFKSASNDFSNFLPLCIKNYKTPTGLSNYIHTHPDEEYFIHGNYVNKNFYSFNINKIFQ